MTRVFFDTSFVLKQPKLVSALSETRRLFWLFCFNIETGSFGASKQPKQTKGQTKQKQICYNTNLFYSPYHKCCLFWLFRYRSETPKETEKFLWQPHTPKNKLNRLSFGLFWFEPKKILFRWHPSREHFWTIFLACLEKVLLVWVVLLPVRNAETNPQKIFGFAKQTEKPTETDWVPVCFGSNWKKNWLVQAHLSYDVLLWRF